EIRRRENKSGLEDPQHASNLPKWAGESLPLTTNKGFSHQRIALKQETWHPISVRASHTVSSMVENGVTRKYYNKAGACGSNYKGQSSCQNGERKTPSSIPESAECSRRSQ
ncbi:unnamed protein product, partial [Choristocarpus tenellus]